MKRPDCDFVRQVLRHLDKPNQAFRNPLHKKLILESLHAPVISLWEKPFSDTEPAIFCEGREDSAEEQYELITNWLYNDFVFLTQGNWTDYETGEVGPAKYWTYFISNYEAHPLHKDLSADGIDSTFMRKLLAGPDLPESKIYTTNPDHFYFGVSAACSLEGGKWGSPVVLGIFCFWFPSPDDALYSVTSNGEYKWVYFPTKSTEDFFDKVEIPKDEADLVEDNCAAQLAKVADLHCYLKYGDRHAVEVLPSAERLAKAKRNPANRNRPWNTASGPHVLLLDRMPATQKPGCGTHASPKPHRRRGHWKTLSHPRYRHHPQFQKKIYCKPSFVGPKQATYEGNIYRLVQPLEEAINV